MIEILIDIELDLINIFFVFGILLSMLLLIYAFSQTLFNSGFTRNEELL